jgi:hypothetical protein
MRQDLLPVSFLARMVEKNKRGLFGVCAPERGKGAAIKGLGKNVRLMLMSEAMNGWLVFAPSTGFPQSDFPLQTQFENVDGSRSRAFGRGLSQCACCASDEAEL